MKNNPFGVISNLMTRRPILLLSIAILGILALLPGISLVRLATGVETLIKPSTSIYQENVQLENSFGGETIVVMYTFSDLKKALSVPNIRRFKEIETALNHTPGVYSVITPATVVEQLTRKQSDKLTNSVTGMSSGLKEMSDKLSQMSDGISNQMAETGASVQGTRENKPQTVLGYLPQSQGQPPYASGNLQNSLITVEQGLSNMSGNLKDLSAGLNTISLHASNMDPGIPETQENLNELLYDNGTLRDIFKNTVVDDRHMVSMVRLQGNLDDRNKEAVIARVQQLVQDDPLDGTRPIVSGKPVLDSSLRTEMKSSMQRMIVLAVGIMVVVLFAVFRVRWRILALPIIFLAVLGTMGIMGFSQVPMTMVSMAVFPILIGLGVDYAIQFHNRYEEEIKRSQPHEA